MNNENINADKIIKSCKRKNTTIKTKNLVLIAFFASLISACSQIQIPAVIPFTLQTFAVFVTAGLLGWKNSTISVLIYIMLGSIGLPVFSGFSGGIGVLFGLTGGYIIGFILTALFVGAVSQLIDKKFIDSQSAKIELIKIICYIITMLLGLALCYAVGTIWFIFMYLKTNSVSINISTALSMCVFPFILFDIIKIIIAAIFVCKLKKHVKL